MISHHIPCIFLFILSMISYHNQYISLCILGMITYSTSCVRLIFHTRVFHSDHNCLNVSQFFVLYKTGYNNPNTNSDCVCTISYVNSMFSMALQTLLLRYYQFSSVNFYIQDIFLHFSMIFYIPMTLVLP